MLTPAEFDPKNLLPPFDNSLSAALRDSGERTLLEFHNFSRDNYSTERFLARASIGSNSVLGSIPLENGSELPVESSSHGVLLYCEQHALSLANDNDAKLAIDIIRYALEVIRAFPFLYSAVSELVWRCHIVRAPDDDYDVSFSDPSIPFSVFISAPARKDRRSVLRVAESLVHETMHLQLTLFELCCPLVDVGSSWSAYSPWKRENRPAQGILHGLYVFFVLRRMWEEVAQNAQSEIDRDFALRRVIEISGEISSVRALEDSPALTKRGSLFLQELFAS
jgi:hypothetical protein